MTANHQALLIDAIERGKDGVETLMAEITRAHDVGEYGGHAEYAQRMAELDDLIDAYDALPRLRQRLTQTTLDTEADMTVAIQLVQYGLRLRQLYREFHDTIAAPLVHA